MKWKRVLVVLLAGLILGTAIYTAGATPTTKIGNLKAYANPEIAMADVYTPWTKNLSLGFELKGTPCLNWTEYTFVRIVKGPYLKKAEYNGWNITNITYITSPMHKGQLYPKSGYLLQKTIVVARKGNQILVIVKYKNVGDKTLHLVQPTFHIHKGVMALTLRVVPSSCNSPFGYYSNGKVYSHYLLNYQPIPAEEVKAMLSPIKVEFSDGSVHNYLDLGLWNVYPPGEIKLEDGSNYAIIAPINSISTTKQIQIVSNWYYWNNQLIGYGEMNLQHAKVTLAPGESAKFVYAATVNEPLTSDVIVSMEKDVPGILLASNNFIPIPTPTYTPTPIPTITPTPHITPTPSQTATSHHPPVAIITPHVVKVYQGQTITLSALSSYDPNPNGKIVAYQWTDENGNILSNSPVLRCTLPAGTHTITLRVTDNYGLSSTDTATVEVMQKQVGMPAIEVTQSSIAPKNGLLTVSVANTGDAPAYDVRVIERIPSNIVVSYVEGATSSGGLVIWSGNLKPSQEHTIRHSIKMLTSQAIIPVTVKYKDPKGMEHEIMTSLFINTTTNNKKGSGLPISQQTLVVIIALIVVGIVAIAASRRRPPKIEIKE